LIAMTKKSLLSPGNGGRLTPNPETAHLGGGAPADYSHSRAVAFAVIGGNVAMAPRNTHLAIFNALRVVASPDSAPPIELDVFKTSGAQGVYENFGVTFAPAVPGKQDLAWFDQIPRELHAMRQATLAGRAWLRVSVRGHEGSLVSWWVTRRKIAPPTIGLVGGALGLSGKCVMEFAESPPEMHTF
jgi:hypothetical protein